MPKRDPTRRWHRPIAGRIGREEPLNPDRIRIPNCARSLSELEARVTERRARRANRVNRVRVAV